LAFLHGGRELVFLRGDIRHKDLCSMDMGTGAERQLTYLPADFDIRDFDISANGPEVVLERVQEHSEVVLVDLPSTIIQNPKTAPNLVRSHSLTLVGKFSVYVNRLISWGLGEVNE
jgi:hypothetical protein